ncbi:MAG: acetyl-CoA carboxylase biotin carboxyl carrier protein subunit [Chloroflexi bacterium]|nr:acetyl-CoA carboxylase biotin carboxyl carrier protein subunit [Chloroflexota bacterium]
MSERDEVLSVLDELGKLLGPSDATTIEVETAEYSVRVSRRAATRAPETAVARERDALAEPERVQRGRATTVGIFSSAKEWHNGDQVERGTVLGAIQSLGHMADITAPADGRIDEVLVAAGAPVEYGQPLFAISLA